MRGPVNDAPEPIRLSQGPCVPEDLEVVAAQVGRPVVLLCYRRSNAAAGEQAWLPRGSGCRRQKHDEQRDRNYARDQYAPVPRDLHRTIVHLRASALARHRVEYAYSARHSQLGWDSRRLAWRPDSWRWA